MAVVTSPLVSGAYWRERRRIHSPNHASLKKGKCRHKQLQSCPRPSTPPCSCPDSGWWCCSQEQGPSLPLSHSLSHSPLSGLLYKRRLSVFIVWRVTRQPADGGLPWPRWKKGGGSFRNGRVAHSLAWWLTATPAGFTTLSLLRYIAAWFLVCVCVCWCWNTDVHVAASSLVSYLLVCF